MANSYRYIEKPDFKVVRDASSSIQPKKGRPLLAQTGSGHGKSQKSDAISLNESTKQVLMDRGPQSLETTSKVNLLYNGDSLPSDPYDP